LWLIFNPKRAGKSHTHVSYGLHLWYLLEFPLPITFWGRLAAFGTPTAKYESRSGMKESIESLEIKFTGGSHVS
jgi:hypothetical protein